MKIYKYKAKNEEGKLISGEVESETPEAGAALIRNKGLFVITLEDKNALSLDFLKSVFERVKFADVVTVTRQLATMINAGLPITDALVILRSQSSGGMQKIISKIISDVEEGVSLSSALSKHPSAFSKTYVALVKSGEVGGVMDDVLVRLADDMEKTQEFRGKVKGALIYPIVVICGMVGVALLMIVFVIPRLTSLYSQFDAELPFMTKMLVNFSNFMISFWPLVIIGVGVLVWGYKIYRGTEKGRDKTDSLILKVPIIGPLQREVILTDLTRTLSLMIGSGVPIIEALTIASQVVSNKIISKALQDVNKMIEKGFPIAFCFSRHPEAFPFILSQMISVGEETGKMDEILMKVSHIFEVESDQKLKALTSAIEPLLLIVIGVGVALLVVSIIMPIYNLTTQIKV